MARLLDPKNKPEVGYSPVYCAMYPELAKIARLHGYALAVHGSLRRDMDLICVPWAESPSEPAAVIEAFTEAFSIEVVGEPTQKPHGRTAHTLSVGFGECAIDLSFVPAAATHPEAQAVRVEYVSRCSGLGYTNPKAAGDIAAIVIDGKRYDLPATDEAVRLLAECDEYLDSYGKDTSIGRGSALHRKMKALLANQPSGDAK